MNQSQQFYSKCNISFATAPAPLFSRSISAADTVAPGIRTGKGTFARIIRKEVELIMIDSSILIRSAVPEDAEPLQRIYAWYVEKTAVSFEYVPPSPDEFLVRMEHIQTRYPFLVAQSGQEILGYANTKAFIPRDAYNWSAETTIYLRPDCRRRGIGRRLYTVLESVSRAQNLTNLNACIGDPEPEDEYLTRDSEHFHARLGYRLVGRFHNSGYKFGRWYNMIWMEKALQPPRPDPPAVIPFPDLSSEQLCEAGLYLPFLNCQAPELRFPETFSDP